MECEKCADDCCADCLRKSTAVFECVTPTNGIRCCDRGTSELLNLMKEVDTTTEEANMISNLNTILNSVKNVKDGFCYFLDGTKFKV